MQLDDRPMQAKLAEATAWMCWDLLLARGELKAHTVRYRLARFRAPVQLNPRRRDGPKARRRLTGVNFSFRSGCSRGYRRRTLNRAKEDAS